MSRVILVHQFLQCAMHQVEGGWSEEERGNRDAGGGEWFQAIRLLRLARLNQTVYASREIFSQKRSRQGNGGRDSSQPRHLEKSFGQRKRTAAIPGYCEIV